MKRIWFLFLTIATLFLSNCRPDPENLGDLPHPTAYSFPNMQPETGTQSLAMLQSLGGYARQGGRRALNLDTLNGIFTADSAFWSFVPTKSLFDLCEPTLAPYFGASFQATAQISLTQTTAAPNVAGRAYSIDSLNRYLFDSQGIDLAEFNEKRLLCAAVYYQVYHYYLPELRKSNASANPASARLFDELFGMFGVPADFPKKTAGSVYFGSEAVKYASNGSGNRLMTALISGRTAVGYNNAENLSKAVETIGLEWESIAARAALGYLEAARAAVIDTVGRNRALTTAFVLTDGLKYNPDSRLNETARLQILGLIGSNLYATQNAQIDEASNLLKTAYGF